MTPLVILPTVDYAIRRLRAFIGTYVPDGYRDDDGVWHEGPWRAEALAHLDVLARHIKEGL